MDFQSTYTTYFERLYRYSFTITRDNAEAEDVVQTIFSRLWERWTELVINTDMSAYLYRSVYNESLNRIGATKKRETLHTVYSETNYQQPTAFDDDHLLSQEQIDLRIQQVLAKMPEQCRKVFLKSRLEDLKYAEIAKELNISIKTVEVHMSKALKIIRNVVRVIVMLLGLLIYFLNVNP